MQTKRTVSVAELRRHLQGRVDALGVRGAARQLGLSAMMVSEVLRRKKQPGERVARALGYRAHRQIRVSFVYTER